MIVTMKTTTTTMMMMMMMMLMMTVMMMMMIQQDGKTALHHAILQGVAENDLDIARLLIQCGANVNIKDEVSHEPIGS